jgi:hypothetical protein
MNFDVEDTRRKLTAKAKQFGSDTAEHYACFNLIQLLQNRAKALPGAYELRHFPSLIAVQMKQFTKGA